MSKVGQVLLRVNRVKDEDNFAQCVFTTKGCPQFESKTVFDTVRKDVAKKIKKKKSKKKKKSAAAEDDDAEDSQIWGQITLKKGSIFSKKAYTFAYVFDMSLGFILVLSSLDNTFDTANEMLMQLEASHFAKLKVQCDAMFERSEGKFDLIRPSGRWKGRLEYDWNAHVKALLKELQYGVAVGPTHVREVVRKYPDDDESDEESDDVTSKPKPTASTGVVTAAADDNEQDDFAGMSKSPLFGTTSARQLQDEEEFDEKRAEESFDRAVTGPSAEDDYDSDDSW